MIIKGKEGKRSLETGKICYAAERLLDRMWTLSFVATSDGVYILTYDRKNKIGYDKEFVIPKVSLVEEEGVGRIVKGIYLSDPGYHNTPINKDYFVVVNPKFIFGYNGAVYKEIMKFPELHFLRGKVLGKEYGLDENHLLNYREFLLTESLEYSNDIKNRRI